MNTTTLQVRRLCAAAYCLVCVGCAKEAPRPRGDSAAATAATLAWAFDVPATWDDRVVLVDSVPGTGTYRSARLFNLTPHDSTIAPQTLLGIFVYDSATWVEAVANGGPPLGDSITAVLGHVFIASLPRSNPFRAGTADGQTFDSLAVDITTVRRGFRVAR